MTATAGRTTPPRPRRRPTGEQTHHCLCTSASAKDSWEIEQMQVSYCFDRNMKYSYIV